MPIDSQMDLAGLPGAAFANSFRLIAGSTSTVLMGLYIGAVWAGLPKRVNFERRNTSSLRRTMARFSRSSINISPHKLRKSS